MLRLKSLFGVTPELCTDAWALCYDILTPTCLPMHFLWKFMFLKQCRTEEVNASTAGCDEDTFRDWVWRVLDVISYVDIVSLIFRILVHHYFLKDYF